MSVREGAGAPSDDPAQSSAGAPPAADASADGTANAPPAPAAARLVPWAILAASVLLLVAVRVRLLGMPLERDEGEYAYGGRLLLRGQSLYAHLYTMKLPGTHAAYALSMALFGETAEGIRIGYTLAGAAATGLVFLLGRRIADAWTGAIAAAAYVAMTAGPSVLGPAAHATHFVVVPALAGFLLVLRAVRTERARDYAVAGLVLGLAPLMKQSGAFLILFAGFHAVVVELRRRPLATGRGLLRLGALGAGVAVPYLVTCLLVWRAGDFDTFRFWTLDYGRAYLAETSWSEGLVHLTGGAARAGGPALLLWGLAVAGLLAPLRDRAARPRVAYLAGLLACSFVAVCPGLYFRPHYFVLMLPAVALLAATAVRTFGAPSAPRRAATLVTTAAATAVALVQPLVAQRQVLFSLPPRLASRAMYRDTYAPFPEAVQVARYIRMVSGPEDRIAMLTSEPEILFDADRAGASGYVYMYPMAEEQPYAERMQAEMTAEVARAEPRYVVLFRTKQEFQTEFELAGNHFEVVCVVEVVPDASLPTFVGAQARNYRPGARHALVVYHRTR